MLRSALQLLRIQHWVKNTFVLAPLVFSGAYTDSTSVFLACLATLVFCLAASSIYIINDIHDVERDKLHADKAKARPIARGDISINQAIIMCLLTLVPALLLSFIYFPKVLIVIVAYVLLMVAYTYYLKHQPIIDIFTIAIGFVLRIYAGALAISVPVSSWMFITTLALALYLAAIKRRQELQLVGTEARNVLQYYSVSLLTRYAEMSAVAALVFYSLYVVSEKPEMVITIPIVLFGIFRYWLVVEKYGAGESPTDVLTKDGVLVFTIVLWVVCTGVALMGIVNL